MKKIIIYIFPLLMLWASVFKLTNWDRFVDSVTTFTMLPEVGRALAVLSVPALEAVPFSLLLMRKHIAANMVVIAIILFFTGILAFHWLNNVQPTCSCLGEWAKFDEIENKSLFWITRNLTLVALALVAVAWYKANPNQSAGT